MPDFQGGDFETKPGGCCLDLAHFQHGEALSDVGHDRQTAETSDNVRAKVRGAW
jgi:hypothetical protein